MSEALAGSRARWHSIVLNVSKDQKLTGSTTSAAGRRMSLFSAVQASRVGSVTRRSVMISSEAKEKASIKRVIQVYDEFGKDVTPRPLYQPEPNAAAANRASKIFSVQEFSGATQTEVSSYTTQQTSGANLSLAGPFSRTYGSTSITKSAASLESFTDEIMEPGSRRETLASLTEVQVRREEIPEQLTKKDLEKEVDIFLTETETIWLFDMPTLMVSTESEEADSVRKNNIIYMELCKNRVGNDRYTTRMMQTINGAPKTKEVQCDKIVMVDKEIMATTWDLYDSFNALEVAVAEKANQQLHESSSKLTPGKEQDKTTPLGSVDRDSLASSSIIDLESVVLSKIHEEAEDRSEAILKSEKFNQDLFFMERVLMENIFQPKLAAYRQLPIFTDLDAKSEHSRSELDNGSEEEEEEEKEEEEEEEEDKEKNEEKELSVRSSLILEFDEKEKEIPPPYIESLWSYECDLTRGNNVSCMAWNKVNPDLLAVGYGHPRFKEQKKGMACCWSLKNPMWPERIYICGHGVTALDFSAANPNLLAVGLFNGTIAIYNVQTSNMSSVLDNRQDESLDKHLGPVWQLKWVEQDRGSAGEDKGEILVSISADGRVTKWFVRKGLSCTARDADTEVYFLLHIRIGVAEIGVTLYYLPEMFWTTRIGSQAAHLGWLALVGVTDLMKLKQTASERKKGSTEKKSEALISRLAPGLAFDFNPKDTNIYLAGTEEGYIHKCSCSYNEQYLETYRGHKGPVYKIAWNPFSSELFLSCSADWSIMLWRQDSTRPILTLNTTTTVINDIMWSPTSPYVFVAVNETRVEIWDLCVSTLDPLIVNHAPGPLKFTTALFAKNTECLLIGDSDGLVTVYALRNMFAADRKKMDALHDIIGPTIFSPV